jgi:hypothetical protein
VRATIMNLASPRSGDGSITSPRYIDPRRGTRPGLDGTEVTLRPRRSGGHAGRRLWQHEPLLRDRQGGCGRPCWRIGGLVGDNGSLESRMPMAVACRRRVTPSRRPGGNNDGVITDCYALGTAGVPSRAGSALAVSAKALDLLLLRETSAGSVRPTPYEEIGGLVVEDSSTASSPPATRA